MEIRARIALEVAKFQANAKVVASQFKAMGTSAQRFQNNVDHYSKRSLDRTKGLGIERIQDASKTGQAILAVEKKLADDRYSAIMQGARRAEKDRTKLELNAVRNTGGITPGTNAGRPLPVTNNLNADQKKEVERYHAWWVQAHRQAVGQQVRDAYAAMRNSNAAYLAGVKERNAANAKAAAERAARERDITTALLDWEKNEQRRYSDWLIANTRKQAQERRAIEAAAAKQGSDAQFARMVGTFRSAGFESKLASTRYALYDVGNRFLAFGAAIEAAVLQSVKAFADFETAFTSVERTSGLTGNALDDMRAKLIDISTTIPVAFADVAKVATLGAQMGIAADSLDEFTNTVVKFASITGISVDETAMSFGRLAQLMDVPTAKFENLSAAVAFTGVNSVATDTEILRMSESIAAASNQAGFAAEETIGFAAALASLKVRPEEARGVITRLFREIDLSVSEGGKRLNDFAKVVGSTSAEAANLWNQDPSQFVQSFLQGAQATGQLNQVITDLGITNTRELNVITRLANNMDVLKSSLADSQEQYVLGTYAQEAYGKVADDLNSKLVVMQNSFTALQAKMGEGIGEALKPIIDLVSAALKALGSLPTPVLVTGTAIAALVGGLVLFKGVMALGIAGLFAMQLAMRNLGVSAGGAAINLTTLRAAMVAVTGQTSLASGAMQFFGLSMTKAAGAARILQISLGVFGAVALVLGTVATVMQMTEDAARNTGKAMFDAAGGAEALSAAIQKDNATGAAEGFRVISQSVKDLTKEEREAKEAALEAAVAREKSKAQITESTEALEVAQKALADFRKETDATSDAIDTNSTRLGENTQELILNALSKYGEGEGQDFWAQLAQIDPQTEQTLTQLGFSAAGMVAAGLEKDGGAEDYAKKFSGALAIIADVDEDISPKQLQAYQTTLSQMGFDYTTAQIKEMAGALGSSSAAIGQEIGFLKLAGKETDGFVKQSEAAVKASQIKAQAFNAAGLSADAEGTEVEALSDALDRYVTAATAVANVGVYDSFANLAKAMQGIKGEIDVLTEDGRNALGAWSSFMKASIDNAVANDTGFIGSVQSMAAGLYALGQEGINTGLQFQQMKQYIITSLAATHPSLKTFAATLTTAMDTEALIKMIDAQLLLMQTSASMGAFMGKNGAANAAAFTSQLKSLQDLRNSLTTSGDTASKFASVYADALNDSAKSSDKAKTALEKLLEKINSAFKYTNAFVSLRGSLADLGQSLNENGRTFDSFSEKGRSNISALQSTIKELAEKSGGNTQKFANDLASLRKTLADAGVGASGLAIVDKVLREIGKTGKVSKKSVEEFTKALGKVSKQEASLAKIVEAIRNIANESKESFDANFAYADSIDNVTLGWQAMADAQKEAANRISDLRDEALEAAASINEVRISIDEANASIAEMNAGRSKLEYQLQIALKYGDALRAEEIKAQIAGLDADIAKERNNIAKANQEILDSQTRVNEINAEVTRGKTSSEIINESRALRNMAGSYAEMTAFMLMNAKEGTDLTKVVNDQVAAFKTQGLAMGYTQTEVDTLANKLRDSLLPQIDAVKQAKIDLGITIDTSKATTILDTFVKDADTKLKAVKPFDLKANTDKAKKDVADAVKAINAQLADIKDKTVVVTTVNQSTGGSALGVIRRASGGLVTGPGTATSDSIAARLSNGEYVVKTAAVKHYGVDFMNALNNMSLQSGSMGGASISVAGSQTVYLSTEDRQLLRAAMDRPIALYTDNATIAKSANDGNSILAQRGIR